MKIRDSLTFDDVLLVPKYSDVRSRSEVDLSVKLTKGVNLKFPIIPANMKTVIGKEMAKCIYEKGGLTILHRFMPIEEQLDLFKSLCSYYKNSDFAKAQSPNYHFGLSVGVKESDYENLQSIIDAGVRTICIDVAHGHSKMCVDMTKYISKNFPDVLLISGNVATADGAVDLWKAGADICKVGVGGGRICSTRIETGNGFSQLSAISDVKYEKFRTEELLGRKLFIISDGGCSKNGDLVKALCFSDLVMAGGMFSGSDEAPGDIIEISGKKYKRYDGSSTYREKNVEGIKTLIKHKGSVKPIIENMIGAIQSGCSYQGVHNLIDLKNNPEFIKLTNAALVESGAHNVDIIL